MQPEYLTTGEFSRHVSQQNANAQRWDDKLDHILEEITHRNLADANQNAARDRKIHALEMNQRAAGQLSVRITTAVSTLITAIAMLIFHFFGGKS